MSKWILKADWTLLSWGHDQLTRPHQLLVWADLRVWEFHIRQKNTQMVVHIPQTLLRCLQNERNNSYFEAWIKSHEHDESQLDLWVTSAFFHLLEFERHELRVFSCSTFVLSHFLIYGHQTSALGLDGRTVASLGSVRWSKQIDVSAVKLRSRLRPQDLSRKNRNITQSVRMSRNYGWCGFLWQMHRYLQMESH